MASFAPPVPAADTDPSWWDNEWKRYVRFYTKARWEHIPGLRMTEEKEQLLRDRALEVVARETDLLEFGAETVPLYVRDPANDRLPALDGVTFELLDHDGIKARVAEYGQCSHVNVYSHYRSMNTFAVRVTLRPFLSRDRWANHENSCWRRVRLNCDRVPGDWSCQITEQADSGCDALAFDDRRWHELPALEVTPERLLPLWDRVFRMALRDGLDVDHLRSPIPVQLPYPGDLYRPFLPTPGVPGPEFRPAYLNEIRRQIDDGAQTSFLEANVDWWRGPIRIQARVNQVFELCAALRGTPGLVPCTIHTEFECRPRESEFACQRVDRNEGRCEPPPACQRKDPS